ncbi:MAG: IS630 transposase-related protein [bacterium]
MAYSIDLRKRVVTFVNNGGSKAEAARRFQISLWCVHDWCTRTSLKPAPMHGRRRKFSWEALQQHVEEYPSMLIKERAVVFGVAATTILNALQQMQIRYKKNATVQRKRL